jgi:uncharacterized RDD family membrane protein YckC
MVCPQCGESVPDTARFCPKCGSAISAAAPGAAPQPGYPPQVPTAAPAAYTAFASYPAAGLGGRIGAYLLDGIVAGLLLMPAAAMAAALYVRANGSPVNAAGIAAMVLYGLGALWAVVYYAIKDGLRGASFGRRIAGETVVSLKTGGPATVGQSFIRNLILWLLGIIDVVVLLVDKEHRRLGDRAASTQVVPTKEFVAMTGGAYVPPGKGLAVMMVVLTFALLVAAGVLGFVLGGASASGVTTGPAKTTQGPAATMIPATTSDADSAAVETAVKEFYDTLNGGDLEKVKSLVTDDTRTAIDPGAFEGWTTTSFEFARSVIDGNTASVYGREDPRRFGGETGGVKFTLDKVGGSWLIQTWSAVDEATVNGVMPSSGQGTVAGTFDAASARDIVTKLLKARQQGDSETIRSLTTANFQSKYGDVWLDGTPAAEAFTSFEIISSASSGSDWTVKVSEEWISGNETGTYTVVEQKPAILVDTWSSESP